MVLKIGGLTVRMYAPDRDLGLGGVSSRQGCSFHARRSVDSLQLKSGKENPGKKTESLQIIGTGTVYHGRSL